MTRELAVLHARENIRVNALCPYVAARRARPARVDVPPVPAR